MIQLRRALRALAFTLRLTAGLTALARLGRVANVAPPLRAVPIRAARTTPSSISADGEGAAESRPSISVLIPARDEADRIGPLLDLIVGAPGVHEVIVVDDQSRDATADISARRGARVVGGAPLPDGWAGKAWALQQGFAAASSDWVVTLDADTRPDPRLPAALVARARSEAFDLVTIAGRFECPTAPSRWLHAAMLTTLVYRFGPPGVTSTPTGRAMANGQCMAVERRRFLAGGGMDRGGLDRGGMGTVARAVVEDVALARAMEAEGARVGFLDGSELLAVRMFESFAETWGGWARSLALPGVEAPHRQVVDLGVVALAQVLPIPRLLSGRGDAIDIVLAIVRIGTLFGTRRAYDHADLAYWLSPLADPLAAAAIGRGIIRQDRQTWRGRHYG